MWTGVAMRDMTEMILKRTFQPWDAAQQMDMISTASVNSKMAVAIFVQLLLFYQLLLWKKFNIGKIILREKILLLKVLWICLMKKLMKLKICLSNALNGFVVNPQQPRSSCMKIILWQAIFQKKEFVLPLNMELLLLVNWA